MIQIANDQTNVEELMAYTLNKVCTNELPKDFQASCSKVGIVAAVVLTCSMTCMWHWNSAQIGDKLSVMAEEYLHDYSDSEICVDAGLCKASLLGIAEKPSV